MANKIYVAVFMPRKVRQAIKIKAVQNGVTMMQQLENDYV